MHPIIVEKHSQVENQRRARERERIQQFNRLAELGPERPMWLARLASRIELALGRWARLPRPGQSPEPPLPAQKDPGSRATTR